MVITNHDESLKLHYYFVKKELKVKVNEIKRELMSLNYKKWNK